MLSNYICHHGIKGQKWGVRRFQDEGGGLTSAGKNRYSVGGFFKNNAKTNIAMYKNVGSNVKNVVTRKKTIKSAGKDISKKYKETVNKQHNYLNKMSTKQKVAAGSVLAGAFLASSIAYSYGVSKALESKYQINSGRNSVNAVLKMSNGNYLLYPGLYPGR